jgi:hypothetical protein
MTRTAQADEIAESAIETGAAAAGLNAAAWASGVDPEGTGSLVGAALVLGATPAAIFAGSLPLENDRAMLAAAEDLLGTCAGMLHHSRSMRQQAVAGYEAACDQIAAAYDDEDDEAARSAIAAAQRTIADCETAIESLDVTIRRLEYAVTCLYRLPGDMEAVYEVPLAHVRSGGLLPHSGDWLSAAPERQPA